MKTDRIGIIKLSSLGDVIHTIPAFALLRRNFPEARISWIAEPAAAELLENFKGLDAIFPIHLKREGIWSKLKEVRRFFKQHKHSFDLLFDFQGLIKSALITNRLRGYSVGFHKSNLREPIARFLYNHRASAYNENQHVIYKNIHLTKDFLTGHPGDALDYPLKKLVTDGKLQDFYSKNNLIGQKYIILNVGGGWQSKILPLQTYQDIISELQSQFKLVLLWGNNLEKERAEYLSQKTEAAVSEYFSFSQLINFIQRSRMIITADTLAMHIADMVNVPSVGIFGPSRPSRNGSLLERSFSIYHKIPCSFCYKKKCDKMECLKAIKTIDIIDAVNKIDETEK